MPPKKASAKKATKRAVEEEEVAKKKPAPKRGRKKVEESEDEEEVEEPKAKKPAAKRGKKKADEEEETKPKKPAAKRGRKKKEESDDDEEEEEAPPKKPAAKRGGKKKDEDEKPAKKPSAKRGKKKEEEEDEDEEEEEKKAPKKPSAKRGKKKDEDEEEEKAPKKPAPKRGKKKAAESDEDEAEKPAKAAKMEGKSGPGARPKTDPYAGAGEVYGDGTQWYDCMLNQTNVSANNNKYYVIQVIQNGGSYRCFTRWGRVGEPGQNSTATFSDPAKAINAFEKKFKEKTANTWSDRANFKTKSGKYTLIEMNHEETEEPAAAKKRSPSPKRTLPCKLDERLQVTLKTIFDQDMFKEEMQKMNIDIRRMPLGALSQKQVRNGYEALEELERAIDAGKTSKLAELTSAYYTLIPHDFGRRMPPTIRTLEQVRNEYNLLNVLSDIETAMSAIKEETEETEEDELTTNFKKLKCQMRHLDTSSEEFKMIKQYTEATNSNVTVEDAFAIDREQDLTRFKEHDGIEYRKLLWHGTNVAVVVAILKTGLRIMPHSGGRVGKGIYFASENCKSAGYTSRTNGIGYMFLAEVALGKQHVITRDDSSLTKPPAGYDSVLAKGTREPDEKGDIVVTMDGKKVVVPQQGAIPTGVTSTFMNSEYLVYSESQVRLRYMMRMKFKGW